MVRSRYARGVVEVRSWCGQRVGAVRGALRSEVRGALPVRCGSLTFQRAIL